MAYCWIHHDQRSAGHVGESHRGLLGRTNYLVAWSRENGPFGVCLNQWYLHVFARLSARWEFPKAEFPLARSKGTHHSPLIAFDGEHYWSCEPKTPDGRPTGGAIGKLASETEHFLEAEPWHRGIRAGIGGDRIACSEGRFVVRLKSGRRREALLTGGEGQLPLGSRHEAASSGRYAPRDQCTFNGHVAGNLEPELRF